MGLVPFTYTHVEYDSGDGLLGPLACLASLAPVFFMVALASTLALVLAEGGARARDAGRMARA